MGEYFIKHDHPNESKLLSRLIFYVLPFCIYMYYAVYKVVITLVSVDEIILCDHSNESFLAYFLMELFIFLNIIYKIVIKIFAIKFVSLCS